MAHRLMTSLKKTINALVLLAWIFSAFIPAGYMPSFKVTDQNIASFDMVICTAYGLKTISANQYDNSDDHDKSDDDKRCDFVTAASHYTHSQDVIINETYDYTRHHVNIILSSASLTPKNWFSQGPPSIRI